MDPYVPPTETDDRQPQRTSADQIPEWIAICGFLAWIASLIWLSYRTILSFVEIATATGNNVCVPASLLVNASSKKVIRQTMECDA